MSWLGIRLGVLYLVVVGVTAAGLPQASREKAHPTHSSASNSDESATTFLSTTRMVTLEVVARDGQGRHATGLSASDFEVFEEIPARGKQKHEQKIAAFREIRAAELTSPGSSEVRIPAGVYTNLVPLQKDAAPLTILLVDGLNTELKYQAQVHVQMLRMLKSLPRNVPVAVFLFGHRLQMLQDFTSDPALLQAALEKAVTASGAGTARLDPRDDPDVLSTQLEKANAPPAPVAPDPQKTTGTEDTQRIPQWVIDAVKRFEQDVYAANMDTRVRQTIEALASLGRHIAGYPGRKNLLWISTSFPIYLSPLIDDSGKPITDFTGLEGAGARDYAPKLRRLAGVLSDAKVAVYPINPAGTEVPTLYEAGTRVRDYSARAMGDSLRRDGLMRANEQDTMRLVAEGTGGRVCTGTNDLGECIRKAVDDSGAFYELAYYPDSRNWNGEYRKIIVKTRVPGLHLAYRQGYFARSEDQKADLQQAACEDYLNATSIPFSAKSMPPDSPEKLKFYLTINPSALTFTPSSAGGRDLNLVVAVCTFDAIGQPFQFMSDALQRQFSPSEYSSLTAHGLPHIVSVPGPKPAALRLLIKDVPSGRVGSVRIKVEDGVEAMPMSETVGNEEQPRRDP